MAASTGVAAGHKLTPVHSQTTRCSFLRALFARIGVLFATKHTTIAGCARFDFSSLNRFEDKMDRVLCSAYVGDMIRIDLTRLSLSLALLGELITLAVHPRTRERLLAIFRIAQGDSAATVCRELQRDHHTVLKWAHDVSSGGPSALVYKHSGGTPSQLCSLAPLLVDVVEESWSLAALSRVKKNANAPVQFDIAQEHSATQQTDLVTTQ